MERADQRDKGKRIVEDVSVELTLGLDGFRASPKKPKILNSSSSMVDVEHSGYDNSNRNVKEFQFSILRTASLPPMETEVEWMQRNDPFSIMRTSSLPMETEMEWRQRNDPFSIIRTSSLPMETEVEWRQRKELLKETEMEWRQRNDPFSIIRTASLPMETEVEWRQGKELPMGTEVDWRQTNDPFSIMRTSSLPMETEVDWRQRNELPMQAEMDWRQKRELQTQMRREARQKRWDQMKNVKVVKENGVNGNCSLLSPDGSQGSVSSSETGFETQQQQLPFQGASGSSNMIPPAASGMSLEQMQQLLIAATDTTNEKSPVFSGKEVIRNFMLNMPGVSANGPNGKKTEGFLYAYKKGEEVKIVCVCHGNFLTPAEFVKHAGGGDVENPLKYITIDPIN